MVTVNQLGNNKLALELKKGDRVEIVEESIAPLYCVGKRGTVLDIGPTKALSEGRLFLNMEDTSRSKSLVDAKQVRLVEVRGMSEKEKEDWEEKSREGKWKTIEKIVSEAREAKKEGSPIRTLAEKLKKLREMRCTIDIQFHGGYKYLRASKSIAGETRTKILGRPDHEWERACGLAGEELQWNRTD